MTLRAGPVAGRRHGGAVWRADRGATSVEMIGFVVPGSLAVILVAHAAFTLGLTGIDVTTAAAAAARVASQQRSTTAAASAAHRTAVDNLAGGTDRCARVEVDTDTSRWGRGGSVTVTVRCTVRLGTPSWPGTLSDAVSDTVTTSARATAPVDTYRPVTR